MTLASMLDTNVDGLLKYAQGNRAYEISSQNMFKYFPDVRFDNFLPHFPDRNSRKSYCLSCRGERYVEICENWGGTCPVVPDSYVQLLND